MKYHIPNKKNGTITTRVVCAVCFIALSFLWLYEFQADMLAVAQHELSGGVTHYDRTIGAVLITLTLFLLQLAVYAVTRLSHFTHALTYMPSFLGLAFLSDVTIGPGSKVTVGHLWWLLVLLFVVWIVVVRMAHQMMPSPHESMQKTGLFSARTWINLLQMAAMMFMVALVGNTNAVDHFKAHAETALMRDDDKEALRVGWESMETDPHLTMLRAFALSRLGLMGEKLFCYPIVGTSEDLLPSRNKLLILSADTIWKHLGGRPAFPMKAQRFYKCLEKDSVAKETVADYVLCSLLIDRRLDAFVKQLHKYYKTDGLLPRHYREALALYAHQHPSAKSSFHDEAIEQEWHLMQQLKEQHPKGSDKQLQMLENFRNTYWYYYSKGSPTH